MLGWIAIIIGLLVLLGVCWYHRKTIKSFFKKNKKKVAAIAVAGAAIGATSSTFIIPEGYRPNTATMISNSNGKYWSATGANIQLAIDDLTSVGTVSLPSGNLNLGTSTLNLSAGNYTLQGMGIGKTVLTSSYSLDAGHAIQCQQYGAGNIVLKDFSLTFDGAGTIVNGIRFDSIDNIVIDSVEIYGFTDVGIFVGGTSPPNPDTPSTNVWIMNCIIHDNLGTGHLNSGIELGQCENVIIRDNYFYDNTRGIYLNGEVKNCTIDSNRLINCGNSSNGYIMSFSPSHNVSVTNNVIIDDGGCSKGIGFYDSYNAIITGNIIMNTTNYGIYTTGSKNIIISDNSINLTDKGIFMSGSDYICADNLICVNSPSSIGIETNADNVAMTGNSIYGDVSDSQYGIYAHDGDGYSIRNNYIYGFIGSSNPTGIRVGESDYNDIKGNNIYRCGTGIRFDGVHNVLKITDNTIKDLDQYGIYIPSTCKNFTINDNSIIAWGASVWSEGGIHVEIGLSGTIADNVFYKYVGTGGQHVISVDAGSLNVSIIGNILDVLDSQMSQEFISYEGTKGIIKDNIGYDYDSLRDDYIWNSNGKYWTVGSDETNLQAAITDVIGGGWVEIPSDTIVTITSSLLMYPEIELRGGGNSTLLRLDDAANCDVIAMGDTNSNNRNIVIKDLNIDGNGLGQTFSITYDGIHYQNTNNSRIENVYISNVTSSGVFSLYAKGDIYRNVNVRNNNPKDTEDGSAAWRPCGILIESGKDIIVSECHLEDIYSVGIAAESWLSQGVHSENIIIEKCYITRSHYGIYVEQTRNVLIDGCYAYYNNNDTTAYAHEPRGIYSGHGTIGTYNTTIINCYAIGNGVVGGGVGSDGIILASEDSKIINCFSLGNINCGIIVGSGTTTDADNCTVEGCTIMDNGDRGIDINALNPNIINNRIERNGDDAIYIAAQVPSDNKLGLIKDNIIREVPQADYGIYNALPNMIISGNMIKAFCIYPIYNYKNNVTISYNFINGSDNDGIKLATVWHNIVTGNNIINCDADGIEVDDSYFCSIGMNVAPDGISETGAADYNSFVGNICYPDACATTGGNSVEVGSIE